MQFGALEILEHLQGSLGSSMTLSIGNIKFLVPCTEPTIHFDENCRRDFVDLLSSAWQSTHSLACTNKKEQQIFFPKEVLKSSGEKSKLTNFIIQRGEVLNKSTSEKIPYGQSIKLKS